MQLFYRKLPILLAFIAIIASVMAFDEDERRLCKCFEEFEPKKESGEWLCRGQKHQRIFSCGEAKPPVCKCTRQRKEVIADIGETNCIDVNHPFDSINCKPELEWDTYLTRHPERRIYY